MPELKINNFSVMTSLFTLFLFLSHLNANNDSIFIKLPDHFDTLNVSYIGKGFARIILDKFTQKTYSAHEGIRLDAQRTSSFYYPLSKIPPQISHKTIDLAVLSDSLTHSSRLFLLRHTFFVIITKNDTAYFYKAKGDYMYKDYKNDVHY